MVRKSSYIKIILKRGEILDGKILIFNLLSMDIKKLNLSADKLYKKIIRQTKKRKNLIISYAKKTKRKQKK